MEITCAQMDVLISFYLEGGLSKRLKTKVEEHLNNCPTCMAKYNILKSISVDLKEIVTPQKENETTSTSLKQYQLFHDNLSAYVDNELPNDENIKIKKFTINNSNARKELEETYNIRKLMSESFKKTKSDARGDFTKNVIKQLDDFGEEMMTIHPLLKVGIAFIITTLILSAIIIFCLTI